MLVSVTRAALLAAALAAVGLAQPPITWSKIVWDSLKAGPREIPHAALMVEVQLDSLAAPALMQLDTGANRDVLYGKTYQALHPKETPGDKYWVGLSGTTAESPIRSEWFANSADFGGEPKPGEKPNIGTIGANFFEQRVLLIDFVAGRIAILPRRQELPAEMADRASFVPLEYRNNKMFVGLTLDGAPEPDMFFDSGSSAFALTTTRRRWLELTGRQSDDAANEVIEGTSWGKPARWVGAPMRGRMCIGKVCIAAPSVFFAATDLPNFDFDKYPFKTSGLFGNAPFDGKYTVVVDLPHQRFGLLEGPAAR